MIWDLCTIDWVAIGSIAAALMIIFTGITLFVTIRQSNKNRKLQIGVLQYQQAQQGVDRIKDKLFEFQTSFDMIEAVQVSENIKNGNYLNMSDKIKSLIRDVDQASFAMDLYMPKQSRTPSQAEFNKIYNRIYIEYGTLLTDLMYFMDLVKDMPKDILERTDYLKFCLSSYGERIGENNIADIIEQVGIKESPTDNIREILSRRFLPVSNEIAHDKELLKVAIVNVIQEAQIAVDEMLGA